MKDVDKDDELHHLNFYIQRNVRYHMRRGAFFTRWSRLTSFVGVFFGSAAAVTFMADIKQIPGLEADPTMQGHLLGVLPGLLALVVALFSAIELVVGVSQRAWLHCDLRRRYLDIDEQLQANPDCSVKTLRGIRSSIRRIEADEPPTMSALELMVRNEVICSMFPQDELHKYFIPLQWWIRATAHWIDWDTSQAQPNPKNAAESEPISQ